MNALQNWRFYDVAPLTSGNTDIQASKVLDMSGYDGVVWIATLTSNTNSTGGYSILRHMHSDSTSTTDMVSCGTTSSTASCAIPASTATGVLDDTVLIVDVPKPLKRYVSAYLTKDSTNSVNCVIHGIQYQVHKGPITQPTSTYGVAGSAVYISPTT